MPSVLIAVEGPLKGTTTPISPIETSIGRITANSIALQDVAVSRRHCVIESKGGQYLLTDLESHNGTFVNGLPVRRYVLQDGDRIEIGKSCFLFQLDPDGFGNTTAVTLVDSFEGADTAIMTIAPPGTERGRESAVLPRLAEFARLIQEFWPSRDEEARRGMQAAMFRILFELAPAERGALLLGDSPTALDLFCSFDEFSEGAAQLSFERSVLEEVFRTQRPSSTGAATGQRNVSVIAAPLKQGDRVLGVIYLESARGGKYRDREMQQLSAIGSLAALAIENARYVESLISENRRLLTEMHLEHSMIGEAPGMQQLFQVIGRVAAQTSTVLIRGESGTGKELVARAIHRNSPRASKPFVAINCAALTDSLLESELFGHEKGAFTGAYAQKRGQLEVAEGGTLFLDEIGELALNLQAKLLRVLQGHEFTRVGGTRTIRANIRVLAATNRNLEEAMREHTFREDLYYRLNVVSISVPPLRERREDIPVLAGWFAQKFAGVANRHVVGIAPQARACLMSYDWPGNVRELENAIERAVVLGSSDFVLPEDLPEAVTDTADGVSAESGSAYHDILKSTKKRIIEDALAQSHGNFTEAARRLGVHPNYLHRLTSNLGLRKK
jgi:Nif-specific regulatory protein